MVIQTENLRLEAERYHLAEVNERFVPHPEGFPGLNRNCLVIGKQGVGKTMVLRKLCFDLKDSDNMLPIYVQLEPWIAKISGEMTYPKFDQRSPLEVDLSICMNIMLSTALISWTHRYGGYEIVKEAISLFPTDLPKRETEFPQWLGEQISIVRPVLQTGAKLKVQLTDYPTVFGVANTLGSATKEKGKSLLFLIDQVDKISPKQFEILMSLLHRGDYLVAIATRPCPCAPEASSLPLSIVPGNDYDIHWIGQTNGKENWNNFVIEVLRKSRFSGDTIEIASKNIQQLTSLSGRSIRTILKICLNAQLYLHKELSENDAWSESVRSFIAEEKDMACEVMSAWCPSPGRFIKQIEKRVISMCLKKGRGTGRAVMQIRRKGDLYLSPRVMEFLRICLREGILSNTPRGNRGLDAISDCYEVDPPLVASYEEAPFVSFDNEVVEFDVSSLELDTWVQRRRGSSGRRIKRVFVPYWMSGPEKLIVLPHELQRRALNRFEVVTGEQMHGSEQWSPKIRKTIEESDLVVCDLSVSRRDVYVEWGWAIGKTKQVILGCDGQENRDKCPMWARERQIRLFGSDSDITAFVSDILHALDSFPDRIASWIDDPSNKSMRYKADSKCVGFVGPRNILSDMVPMCESVVREHDMDLEIISSMDPDTYHGGILFDCIRLARRASILVLFFDSSEADLLTCVTGGIFTSSDYLRIDKKSRKKKLLLVNTIGYDLRSVLPGLLRSKPDAETHNSIQSAQASIRKNVGVIANWRREVLSKRVSTTRRRKKT